MYQKCNKYPFVQNYITRIRNKIPGATDRYAIFVLHEKSYLGGLGDRLGGLISAFAFALRTNRTFLIEADSSFQESFEEKDILKKRNFHFYWPNLVLILALSI